MAELRAPGRGVLGIAAAILFVGCNAILGIEKAELDAGRGSTGDGDTVLPDDALPNADAEGGRPGDAGSGIDVLPDAKVTAVPPPLRGSAIALSADDSMALVVNRDVGTVAVVAFTYKPDGTLDTAKRVTEIGVGREPWQVVMSPDGKTAYAVLRADQQVVRIDSLTTNPSQGPKVQVGSEPTAIAITPSGNTLWVANWADGTVTSVDTKMMQVGTTVNLNTTLAAATGNLLGLQAIGDAGSDAAGDAGVRAGLAHPRALAITNNGDTNDDDETLYVTEYFAQRVKTEVAATVDTSHEGIVYRIPLATPQSASIIELPPLANMGFTDTNGDPAGCYPNQLQAITLNGNFAYVTSTGASPKGPLGVFTPAPKACMVDGDCPSKSMGSCGAGKFCATNCDTDADCGKGGSCDVKSKVCHASVANVKTTTAPLLSVIDLTTANVTTTNLNASLESFYKNTPDNASRRYPLVPNDLAFVPGSPLAYLSAGGADAVFPVEFTASSVDPTVGSAAQPFVDLNPPGIGDDNAGLNPIGIAASNTGKPLAFVANDGSLNLTVIDVNRQTILHLPTDGGATASVVRTANLPAPASNDDHLLRGKRAFNTGMVRWSLNGQGWLACASCHPDGLSDGVTWYFPRGPRQTISLDGSFSSKSVGSQRIFGWTAVLDEVADFELYVRQIAGGVGATVSKVTAPPDETDRIDLVALGNAGLNGSATAAATPGAGSVPEGKLNDWADIQSYLQNVRSPRHPTTLDANMVEAGKSIFEKAGCGGCHAGGRWTESVRFYTPSVTTNETLGTLRWTRPGKLPGSALPATGGTMRYGAADPAVDQIQCVLRNVGTFDESETGVGVLETRDDMVTPAQGAGASQGFNPPSLLGLATGAPYLHAGNVRTLEALFNPGFAGHYAVADQGTLGTPIGSDKAAQLVQFLLSIDEDTLLEGFPGMDDSTLWNLCPQ